MISVFVALQQVGGAQGAAGTQEFAPWDIPMGVNQFGELLGATAQFRPDLLGKLAHRSLAA
jgi:hypothetical protein